MIKYGDCLELMEKIPAGSVDMILTDPPYFIDMTCAKQPARLKQCVILNELTAVDTPHA